MYQHIKNGVKYRFVDGGNPRVFNWFKAVFPTWESFTFDIFETVQNNDKIAIDIGGWIGATAIWLSKNFNQVIVVEPDKIALRALKRNLSASECYNCTIIDKPIASTVKTVHFGPNKFQFAELGDSTSQIKSSKTHQADNRFETITLSGIIEETEIDPSDVGFIKVDIEGGEEDILDALFTFSQKYKIPLYISFHIDWWNDKNIYRFNHLFETAKTTLNQKLEIVQNPCDLLAKKPFHSILFTW